MMKIRTLHNQKNVTVLSASDLARIRRHARPQEIDHSIEDEKTRSIATHEKTLAVTETWGNSIVNQRKARINRLQQEKEEHEEELRKIDEQERQIQKSQRREKLLQSAEMAFQEKPEIRAVNSQLLLHEVTKQRQRQIILKERQKEMERQKEDQYYQEQLRQWQEYDEKEKEAARLKREKAMQFAEGFKQQRLEDEERRMEERTKEVEEEAILQNEAKRLLAEETMQTIKRRELQRKQNEENRRNNESLSSYKARARELEKLEDERIKQLQIKVEDEQLEREAAEKKRRQDRQAHLDRLIEIQAKNLEEIKAKQQTVNR